VRELRGDGDVELLLDDPEPRRGRSEMAAHLLGPGHRRAHDRHARRRRGDDDGVRHAYLRSARDDHRLSRHGLVLEGAADGTRRTAAAHGGRAPEKTWRQRLATLRSYPSQKSVSRFVAEVIEPSLTAVAEEFRALGYSVDLTQEFDESTGINENTLVVDMGDQ